MTRAGSVLLVVLLATAQSAWAQVNEEERGDQAVLSLELAQIGVLSAEGAGEGECGRCRNDPAGTVHTFFSDECSTANYCYYCVDNGECEEESPCHRDFEQLECNDCHDDCDPGEELVEAVLAAIHDVGAMMRLVSTGEGGLTFNEDRGAIQASCGTRVTMHLPLTAAMTEALLRF